MNKLVSLVIIAISYDYMTPKVHLHERFSNYLGTLSTYISYKLEILLRNCYLIRLIGQTSQFGSTNSVLTNVGNCNKNLFGCSFLLMRLDAVYKIIKEQFIITH